MMETRSQSMCVRFSPDGLPNPPALAAAAVTGVLLQCHERRHDPSGLMSVAIGPAAALVELFDKVKGEAESADPRTIANEDQVRATFAAEPNRFAALAWAWATPREQP
jgi:hypothetical protein